MLGESWAYRLNKRLFSGAVLRSQWKRLVRSFSATLQRNVAAGLRVANPVG